MAETGERLIRHWEAARGRRVNFDTYWQDTGRYVWPSQSDFTTTAITPGDRKNYLIFDDRVTENSKKGAAVLEYVLTRRGTRWHRTTALEKELKKNAKVRAYFQEVDDVVFAEREARGAGCYSSLGTSYRSHLVFGNDCLFVDDRWERGVKVGLRYKHVDLRDVWIARDWQGGVAAVFWRYKLPASQLAPKFGTKVVPARLLEKAKAHPFEEVELLTVVEPNPEHQPESVFSKQWLAYDLVIDGKEVLRTGGYEELPFIFSSMELAPGEDYGRGIAMDVLPTVKLLNEMLKTMIRAQHKIADPPLLVRDDGVLGVRNAVRLRPGSITRGGIDANGRRMVEPLYTGAELAVNLNMVEFFRAGLDRAFFIDLFTLLVERPQMTASEVLERSSEKGVFLGPIIGGQQNQKLAPMFEREIGCLARQGKLPEMPGDLEEAGGEYALEYETPAAQLQRAGEVNQLEQALASLLVMSQHDRRAAATLDLEKAARHLLELRGVRADLIRDEKEVTRITTMEQEAAEQAEMIDRIPMAAKAAKDLAGAGAASA